MLVITEPAREAIRNIIEESEVGPNGGLRIFGSDDETGETAFEFELAPEPADGDEVVRDGDAVVFLDQTAAELLADKILDAHSHGDHVHFSLDEQESDV
jgi:iron-sulfur cluster assembly protein